VTGLKLVNITIHLDSNDRRPAFICEDGKDIEITGCKIPETSGAPAVIRLENVEKASITKMEVKGSADVLVKIEGKNSKGIRIENNQAPGVKKAVGKE
jgi:hypothetical protein